MSIVISSGSVTGADVLVDAVNRAVRLGIENGVILALNQFNPTIAKRTGSLRRAFDIAARQTLRKALFSSSERIVISGAEIQRFTEALLFYAQYHFNVGPQGQAQYRQPTTPGTEPIKMRELRKIAIPLVKQEIAVAVRNEGARAVQDSTILDAPVSSVNIGSELVGVIS